MKKPTCRLLSAMLALCMMLAMLPAAAFAADPTSGKCGDSVTWTYSNGTLKLH